MAADDIIRYIDSIARDKEIDSEELTLGIEQAVQAAVARKYGVDDLEIRLDRDSGEWITNYEIDLEGEGRILAQAVKQAIIGKVREQERDVLYDEFEQRIGEIVTGSIHRIEGDKTIVNLGRNMEGTLPRSEKVRGENYNIGDRIRSMVLEVKKVGSRVRVVLTRAHRDLVRCLFELEVPEIADGIIAIRRIEREPGYRTKLAVHSSDDRVDCVGACVGVRGTRIKSIIDELNGERIDIIRWNEDAEQLIMNALKPADVSHIELDPARRSALVLVDEDQLSLAIGRKGQNVRLASKLTGWEIDIMTRSELERSLAPEPAEGAEAAAGEAGGETAEGAEAPESGATETETSTPETADADAPEGATAEAAASEPTAGDTDPGAAPTSEATTAESAAAEETSEESEPRTTSE